MSNLLGKAIVEGKKIVDSITEKATPVVTEAVKNFKEQSADLTSKAKRAIDISVLRAEIEDLYTDFGKATFEWGLMPSNEKALEIMKVLYEKTDLLEKLEAEVAAEKEAKAVETEVEGPEVIVTEEKTSCETPAEETPAEEIPVKKVEDKAEVKTKAKTSTRKPKTKKADAPVEDNENKKPLDK